MQLAERITANTEEFTTTDIRRILQELFPHRRLVLSQFTFFNHVGVAKPTGETFRRKRRCYKLMDILPIACVLALKEEGIPLKNIVDVPSLIQIYAEKIFKTGPGCRLNGLGSLVSLDFPGGRTDNPAINALLDNPDMQAVFWGYDVGMLAEQIGEIAGRLSELPAIPSALQQAA